MRRNIAHSIGEILRDYFEDITQLNEMIMESRIRYAWRQLLGPMVTHYTRTIYVRDRILYVSLTSSVLRNELLLTKEKLKESINKEIGNAFLFDLVIR